MISSTPGRLFRRASMGLAVTLVLIAFGCERVPRLDVRPVAYDVDVKLDPAGRQIEARVALDLESLDPDAVPPEATIELSLHPDLRVTALSLDGTPAAWRPLPSEAEATDALVPPTVLSIELPNAGASHRIVVEYGGVLWQDVKAGEVEGEVHNFAVSAHVGEEGIYLEPDGFWYPRIELPEGTDPDLGLASFRLTADPVDGFELVAGAESQPSDDGRLHWATPFPHDGLVLLGGPLERHSDTSGPIALHAVLAPGKAEVGADILAASREYLDRYQELIGPYPFSEFTVLEAFFSSGFAFPTCTQIAGSQLSAFKQYRRHGYLDHELLHNWWGNGVLVDVEEGNWCEGLSTYLGNDLGYVLDGDVAGARRQRRNHSNFLSAIEPEDDLPLATFGREDGAGRGIGYQKGAAVFHMLARRIGDDALFAGLRRLATDQMGRHADWDDIQRAMETESGDDLGLFFEQWVHGAGSPLLHLEAAQIADDPGAVTVTITQEGTEFTLDVPLRLHYDDGTEDVTVTVEGASQVASVPCRAGLRAVELDPDYHVFRKLKPEETMPTSSLTRRAEHLLIVLPDDETDEPYRTVADSFRTAVLGEEDEPEEGHQVVELAAADVTEDDLTAGGVLVLGDAVHSPTVSAFLARTRSPAVFEDGRFRVRDDTYDGDGHAVFLTVHHPDDPQRGVTVYHGNTTAALSNAGVLGFYPNSLLVFDTPSEGPATASSGMPRAKVVERIDFEFHDRIDF